MAARKAAAAAVAAAFALSVFTPTWRIVSSSREEETIAVDYGANLAAQLIRELRGEG